ncbi:MAG: hypothetical protein PHC71_06065 [Candidatus Omnitrophica bacterium]|nr:hypothetical protein [Candidatus Omnitrophota bacterium]
MQKEDFYKGVKTVGFVSLVPFMLAAGALSGYFAGVFLKNKFNLPVYVVLISVAFGFGAGVMEMVKVLRILAKMNKK